MEIVQPVNAETLETEIENGVVLVDFSAPWCRPCRLQKPVIEQLAKQHVGKVMFAEINVDANHQAGMKFDILSIPTLILFKEGKEVGRFVGLQSESTLSVAIEMALK